MKYDKLGFIIVLLNILLNTFLLSSNEDKFIMFITATISNLIAISFNCVSIKLANKKCKNIISLIINILILITICILHFLSII